MEIRKGSDPLVFYVNGKKITENYPDPEWTLLYYLRYKLRLTGAKEGCAEGGCGACTVMVSRYNRKKMKVINLAINACLTPVCSVHGAAIVTVEGIGSVRNGLHPVQERIALSHGSQCGFCTGGFVISMYTLLRNNPLPTEEEMETSFQGNLCRCTGYRPILQGFKSLCKPTGCCQNSTRCCQQAGSKSQKETTKTTTSSSQQEVAHVLHDESQFKPYDPSQDPIFPPELQISSAYDSQSVTFQSPNVSWYRPVTFDQLLELKDQFPHAKLVGGNTEIGIDVKYKKMSFPVYIQLCDSLSELKTIKQEDGGIWIGAGTTLSDLQTFCSSYSKEMPHKLNVFEAIAKMLLVFGGQQIRNAATIGGNLVTASPISDLNPIITAAGCSATLFSKARGSRVVKISGNFFTGYRRTIIEPDEVLTNIFIPNTEPNQLFWAAKQSRRKDDDIAIVNSAISIKLNPVTLSITEASLVFGGLGPTTRVAHKASEHLLEKKLDTNVVDQVLEILRSELHLDNNAPGGMVKYRPALAVNLFFKFYHHYLNWTSEQVKPQNGLHAAWLSTDKSVLRDCYRPEELKASQLYQIVPENQSVHDLVGRPVMHVAAAKHATGEAIYTDDTPILENELFGALVLSRKPTGKIISVDSTKALSIPGVISFIDANDLPREKNLFGCVVKDENVFAQDEVVCCGQIVGLVVAETQALAEKAAELINIQYEVNSDNKPILTIEDAIERKSYLSVQKVESCDRWEEIISKSDVKLEGSVRMGGQEHFYMETQSCLAIPKEDDELEVLASTQSHAFLQGSISFCLGVPAHKITVKCRRMGGAFGGKECRTAALAIAASVAARKLQRPVRLVLNRVDDMKFSGFRHPFLCNYKVGCTKEGKIETMRVQMYCNAGCSLDLSTAVMTRAIMTVDSGYNIPNWSIEGYVCKTNLPSNTAFRGFGGPQGSFLCETIFDAVATTVGRDLRQIRALHLYKNGDVTPYDYVLDHCTVRQCWEECIEISKYAEREKAVREFNQKNRWKKRGIAIIPTKHLIGFTESFLNQAGALVMIYRDGSVSLNHGGTEMGQGLHTKMIQIASRVLEIPTERIYLSESSTDKVPNTSSTAGSLSSDLNGPAVIDACEKLKARLKPYREANPTGTWNDWVNSAYFDRTSLSATGFYSLDIGFDLETKKGKPCNYVTYGVGCSEMEIDVLTGDHTVLRTDIVMDLGESLNPAIDIGQIEGGFVQGYGLFTLEELLYSPDGNLLTKGPGMYKIPTVADIPKEFHVSLLRGAPNPRAVYSSKAVGEPPLFLGSTVFFAIKDAIRASRLDNNLSSNFRLNSPATVERILLACQGIEEQEQYEKVIDKNGKLLTPWSIIV